MDASQLYTLLNRYGGVRQKNKRFRLVRELCRRKYVQFIRYEGEPYLSVRPDIQPVGRYRQQIECFWILLDYLGQVDEHEATGMAFPIRMRIQEREYDIGFVEQGAERYYAKEMSRGGDRKYILVVEDADMIPALQSDNIAAITTIGKKKAISYYTIGGDDNEDGTALPGDCGERNQTAAGVD